MKITNCQTKNSVATFSLGRCVVSSVAFLMGMTAVVLGSMFALSAPSFALSTPLSDAPSFSISAERSGTGDIEITNEDEIRGNPTGITAEHTGMGDIRIVNEGTIWGKTNGIHAEHDDVGNIVIRNKNFVRGENVDGIRAYHRNHDVLDRDIRIANEGTIWGSTNGIFAFLSGRGDIVISNKGFIIKGGTGIDYGIQGFGYGIQGGIRAGHLGRGDIVITNENFVWGGIRAGRFHGSGGIVISNKGSVIQGGIRAEHSGRGDIGITNEDIVKGSETEADDIGIRADHSGRGDIGIVNEGTIDADDGGIYTVHRGVGDIVITNERFVRSNGISAFHHNTGDVVISNKGLVWDDITVYQYDTGDIKIVNEGTIVSDSYGGIRGNKSGGTGDVRIVNKGRVKVEGNGISAYSRTGDIVVKIDDGSTVISDSFYGIRAVHGNAGEIEIDVSGTVSGGIYNGPIRMMSSGDKTLILRPGFELKSGQPGLVDITSAGEGDGILELNQDNDGTSASETLDFEALDFEGFNEFAKRGRNTWKISGVARYSEVFDTATIWEGTLRFADGVTFKMAPAATGADPNYFKIESGAVLEVVGSNSLNGNLDNLGKIVFTYDPDVKENPASVLAIENDYKGWGGVIFDVSSGSWQADRLRIGRNNVNQREVTKVRISGEVSNFSSADNEYLPMEIEVVGAADPGSFVTGVSGGYDVNHHKYLLGHSSHTYHVYEQGEINEITLHRWRFFRGEELSNVSGTSFSYEEDITEEVDTEGEITLDPGKKNSELGIMADVRGHEGGVWGRQQSLRTSSGPSIFAGRGLRKTDERVHFGYDTPAIGFMGGDMVVRTSVSRGFSISDILSSSGRNRINMESDAAALSASWWSPGGFYVGGQTRYIRSSSNISTEGFAVARDNEGVGVGASAKAGYRFAVPLGGMDFSVAPQVQLLWSNVDFDDFTGLTGEVVSLEDGELVTGRLGLLWDGEWQNVAGSGRIYGKINLHNALDGETTVSVSGVPLSRERSDLSTDGRLGVSYEWNEGYAVRGEVYALRREDAGEIRVDFGMSIDF